MKLSRNKIRKIRKQQHQSVRKWKKQNKSARRTTFRQSRRQNMMGVMTKYPAKLTNVVNRTLKKYIPVSELNEIKEQYRKFRQQRRKKTRYEMTGGAKEDEPISSEDVNVIIDTALSAGVAAAANAALNANAGKPQPVAVNTEEAEEATGTNEAKSDAPSSVSGAGESSDPNPENSDVSSSKENNDEKGNDEKGNEGNTDTSAGEPDADAKKDQPLSLGPDIEGDISIGTEEHECKDENEVWKLVQFLIEKGLPYYIQIELKSGEKPLNKNDTSIFDLHRILYGKFTKNIKNIPENKRQLYLEAKETVGIANSELYGNSDSGLFIYTGEKGQILEDSTDTNIQVRLLQDDPDATPIPPLPDSKRLYKIKGKGADVKPASIDTVAFLTKLDQNNKIDTSEFRLQIAPMTPSELKKAAQSSSSGNSDPEAKVVVDESNTYIVNLDVGCKITAVKTLKNSLEHIRLNLENDKEPSKKTALDVFTSLNELLQKPEFAANDGYDDFKEQVYGYSYIISGSERKYGFTQLLTFFQDKNGNVPPALEKEFFKLMNLLGHGPGGANGDCLRFEGTSQSIYELSRIQTFEENGKIVTKKTDTLDSASNINGFMKQLSKIGDKKSGKEEEGSEKEKGGEKEDKAGEKEEGGEKEDKGGEKEEGGVKEETETGNPNQTDVKQESSEIETVEVPNPNLNPAPQENINEDVMRQRRYAAATTAANVAATTSILDLIANIFRH